MSDLDALYRDLGTVPLYSKRFVHAALGKTALGMKKSWQEHAEGPSGSHARGYPFSVDYDVTGDFPRYEAEIGPNLGRGQGALGILEDAPGGVTAAPQKARPKVVSDNEADFEKGLDKAVDDALRRAGL